MISFEAPTEVRGTSWQRRRRQQRHVSAFNAPPAPDHQTSPSRRVIFPQLHSFSSISPTSTLTIISEEECELYKQTRPEWREPPHRLPSLQCESTASVLTFQHTAELGASRIVSSPMRHSYSAIDVHTSKDTRFWQKLSPSTQLPFSPVQGTNRSSPRTSFLESQPINVSPTSMQERSVVSILRKSSYQVSVNPSNPVEKVTSIESDLPSLASSESHSSNEEGCDNAAITETGAAIHNSSSTNMTEQREDSMMDRSPRTISFDSRVWVREFERDQYERDSIWYRPDEMEEFRRAAIKRIIDYNTNATQQTINNCTSQRRPTTPTLGKALFSHEALALDVEDTLEMTIWDNTMP